MIGLRYNERKSKEKCCQPNKCFTPDWNSFLLDNKFYNVAEFFFLLKITYLLYFYFYIEHFFFLFSLILFNNIDIHWSALKFYDIRSL